MTSRVAWTAAPLALIAAGCTSVETRQESLEGTTWQVTHVAGASVPETPMYRLEFRNGRLGGRFGCNSLDGAYRADGAILRIADLVATQMGCTEPAATHEARAMAILARPLTIDWRSDERLTLDNPAGAIRLRLKRSP